MHVKVHAVIQAQLLNGWAPKEAALHALDVHSLRGVQQPVMQPSCSRKYRCNTLLPDAIGGGLTGGLPYLTLHRTRGWTHRSKNLTGGTVTSKRDSLTRLREPPRGTCGQMGSVPGYKILYAFVS